MKLQAQMNQWVSIGGAQQWRGDVPAARSPIDAALDGLEAKIARLNELACNLSTKLSPVMVPLAPACGGSGGGNDAPASPTTQRILGYQGALAAIEAVLQEIYANVEC